MSQIKTVGEILLEKLKKGRTLFVYKKSSDGSLRPAIGTLNPKYIPIDKMPKKEDKEQNPKKSILYYDLEKDSWRTCNVGNLINLEEE